jgi:hypothetical protein
MDPIEPAYGTTTLLLIAAAAVAVLLFLIMKVKLHAFVSAQSPLSWPGFPSPTFRTP